MTPIKRPIIGAAAAALLALSLSACGGGAGPTDASKDEFCNSDDSGLEGLDSDDPEEAADAAHKVADRLKEIGTPKEIDGDAREGFEIFVNFLSDVSADDVEKLAGGDESDVFSDDDQAKVDAFLTKQGEVCGVPDISDLESDLPSDLPS